MFNQLTSPQAGWSLRWISILFTPTFVTLPLSPDITADEVGKMIAVFGASYLAILKCAPLTLNIKVVGFAVMLVLTAYMTRGLQLLTGSRKKARAARAEELGALEDEIPIAQPTPGPSSTPASTDVSAHASTVALTDLVAPEHAHGSAPMQPSLHVSDRNVDNSTPQNESPSPPRLPQQTPPLPPRARLWAAVIQSHLDVIIYLMLFLCVSLPLYYASGYAMPLHLSTTVLMYFAALSLPLQWKQFLHPVIVSSFLTVLVIWIFGVIHGEPLESTLGEYSTGLKYLQLWERTTHAPNVLPGAGDILGTVLDASIVSLALPMYQYRRELVEHFAAIILPNIVLSIGSLYAYPKLCFAIGISATRSLAFASRSLTLALAIPATENLGGDRNTVAAVAIMSGIVGALIGGRVLTWLRIPEGEWEFVCRGARADQPVLARLYMAVPVCCQTLTDVDKKPLKVTFADKTRALDDYVTRGVTLGANSSAVATALLLRSDPRAAALSSLSMSLFGTITVLFTSIPPIADTVKSLVGL